MLPGPPRHPSPQVRDLRQRLHSHVRPKTPHQVCSRQGALAKEEKQTEYI